MIHIHVLLFLAMLELAAVFMGLWLWWFFKSRKQTQRIAVLQSRTKPESASAPATEAFDAGSYIIQELGTTHTQLGVQSETTPELSTVPLTLRAAYLDLEREFAQGQERDAEFWDLAREKLAALLEEFAPTTAPALPDDEMLAVPEDELLATPSAPAIDTVDAQHVKQLMDKQASTITELKDALTTMIGDQENGPEVIEKVDKLGRASRELAMCVSILEDDNNLLRERLLQAGIIAD